MDNIFHENQKDNRTTTGILLTNLGTPDAPSYGAIWRYLREFLSDRRVIELPRLLWWCILYGLILPLRPFKIAKKYAGVWLPEGSPLLVYSRRLQQKLQAKMDKTAHVVLGMRYGNPSIRHALESLQQQGIRKLVVLPLYPQYSATTTASTFDAVSRELHRWRFVPEVKFISGYADFPPYIAAIADSIQAYWKQHGRGEKLLISFHGLPKRNLAKGDPYYCLCHKSARLIAEKLQLNEQDWMMVFQSRFGAAEWLQPYCDQTLDMLAQQGIKTLDIICPGFPVDCLETLEEISQTYAERFHAAGGKELRYIPALNASEQHAALLQQLVEDR